VRCPNCHVHHIIQVKDNGKFTSAYHCKYCGSHYDKCPGADEDLGRYICNFEKAFKIMKPNPDFVGLSELKWLVYKTKI